MRANDDPRSPATQFAEYVRKTTGLQNFGAFAASEVLLKAIIAREAERTLPHGYTYADWLKLWLRCAAEIGE